jgi:hypothetical protein
VQILVGWRSIAKSFLHEIGGNMHKIIVMAILMLLSLGSAGHASEVLHTGGRIDWCRGESNQIEVVGVGDAPTYVTGILQAKKFARTAAAHNAYDSLTKIINELQVDSERTVFSLTVENEAVREKIASLIKQAKLTQWEEDQDRIYLGFQVNMFGADGLMKVALDALNLRDSVYPRSVPTVKKVADNMALEDVYSSVIVDARNIGFSFNLLPKIYDVSGRLIYEYRDADRECLIVKGLVDYKKSYDIFPKANRSSSGIGEKPLIVKALKMADNRFNIVISTEDADKILEQNAKWGFLKACSVSVALQEQQCE